MAGAPMARQTADKAPERLGALLFNHAGMLKPFYPAQTELEMGRRND